MKTYKKDTHIVIKREDASKYLSEEELRSLDQILDTIKQGRKKDGKKADNEYYICNTDEPYAHIVRCTILGGEDTKKATLSIL